MKFSELIQQPISLVTENDILKDIVRVGNSLQDVINKISGKNPQDILVVYVDEQNKVAGVITDSNISSFLDKLPQDEKEPKDVGVSNLPWTLESSILIQKSEKISVLIERMKVLPNINIFIVVDEDNVYAGKVKRNNFIEKIRKIVD